MRDMLIIIWSSVGMLRKKSIKLIRLFIVNWLKLMKLLEQILQCNCYVVSAGPQDGINLDYINQRNQCRFRYLGNAIFQPSKIKPVLVS